MHPYVPRLIVHLSDKEIDISMADIKFRLHNTERTRKTDENGIYIEIQPIRVIPEPGALLLFVLGLVGLTVTRRPRRRRPPIGQ